MHSVTLMAPQPLQAYYKLSFVDKRIDNPEEVIVNDTQIMCSELAEIVEVLLGYGALSSLAAILPSNQHAVQ
jgi:ABC-type uncharacterized transport system fused permease/ATPase subunit